MSWGGVRLGIGSRVTFDGEIYEITEWLPGITGTEVVLTGATSACRMSLVALLTGDRVKLLADTPGPSPDDQGAAAATTLLGLSEEEMQQVRHRGEHVRELLTGYRSGSGEMAFASEPQPQFSTALPLMEKYAAKATELGVDVRTVRRWVRSYIECGEAGLASDWTRAPRHVDPRWSEVAEQIMVEHTDESKPSKAAVIFQTMKRLERLFGAGAVEEPSRATAYRELELIEKRRPLFGGTTKRNREIAERPSGIGQGCRQRWPSTKMPCSHWSANTEEKFCNACVETAATEIPWRSNFTSGAPVHDDLVERDFSAQGPNQLWLSDITEHPTREGKLYLCAIKASVTYLVSVTTTI